jgi:rod shape-determining protein MreC
MAIVLLSFGQALHIDRLRGAAATVFEPAQSFFSGIGDNLRGAVRTMNSIGGLNEENARLRRQVADLQQRLNQAQQATLDDAKLKDALGLREELHVHTLGAPVIGRDPEGLSQTITIRAGSHGGVRKGMVVLGLHGLVGHVIAVQGNSSQVQLISDRDNPVNVALASTHLGGTLRLSEDRLVADFLQAPTDLQIATGEKLLTSGIGGNYPRGLPVGEVMTFRYQAAAVAQTAVVAPLDDLAHLEYVQVDLDFLPEVVP